MYNSLREIRAAHKGYWFDKDSMRFFDSKILPGVYPAEDGAYFISSERRDENQPRLYTVRFADSDGDIWTEGEFQGHNTLSSAKQAAINSAIHGSQA
jgi:hypothetical protein